MVFYKVLLDKKATYSHKTEKLICFQKNANTLNTVYLPNEDHFFSIISLFKKKINHSRSTKQCKHLPIGWNKEYTATE